MKTLVNKNNPKIRITAPEIEEHEEEQMFLIPVGNYCIPMCIPDWTLVEEEPPVEVEPEDLEKILELVEKPLKLFTERNLDRRGGL